MRWIASLRERARGADEGQGLAEYGLILGLVAIAAITALGAFGSAVAASAGFQLFS